MENNSVNTKSDTRIEKIRKVLDKRQAGLTVVMENINDLHNFSAVLRSCDAVGILEVHALYHGGQPFPEPAEKSSASARKWVDLHMHDSVRHCYDQLRREGKKIFTTHMSREAVSLFDMDLTGDIALVFGNEHAGVSDEALSLADGNFLIPQVGMTQSLNISVACAVSLYEAFRQRQAAGMYDSPRLGRELYNQRFEQWLIR